MSESALIETQNSEQLLLETSQKLVPWWSFDTKDLLKKQTESNPESYLNSFYLFPLSEISVNADCDDIPGFINDRFHNILAAASHSELSVALVVWCKWGQPNLQDYHLVAARHHTADRFYTLPGVG